MVQANRDQDCLDQFRACHIVGLVGTNRKHDLCIQQNRHGPFTRLQWSKGEPSTGLELWVHRRYISPKHFRGHWSGEGELQGRVGAARFKTPQLDLLCVVVYMPPNNTKRSVCEKICRWLCDVVSAQGHRCVPLLFMDGNAHLGLVQGAQHLYTPSQSPSVGRANPALENQNGTLLRKFAERHFLCFSNTFFHAALLSMPITGDIPLGLTTLFCPKVCSRMSRLAKCGTERGMHCRSLTVLPVVITAQWSSRSMCGYSTVMRAPHQCGGIMTSCPNACVAMVTQSLYMQWRGPWPTSRGGTLLRIRA